MNNKTLTGSLETSKVNFGVICGQVSSKTKLIGAMASSYEISGTVFVGDCEKRICGQVSNNAELMGAVASNSDISGTVFIEGGREKYNGTYEVTPRVEEQTFATANKVMINDLVVKEIPYAEVSNPAGGTTVIIG